MDDSDERLIDHAATCSQHKALTDDESVRECIYLNIIRPLRERINALEAALRDIAYADDAVPWIQEKARAALAGRR